MCRRHGALLFMDARADRALTRVEHRVEPDHVGLAGEAEQRGDAFAGVRHDGVEVDHPRDALAGLGDDPRRDGTGIAVRDQHHAGQIFIVQHVDDIGDVRRVADIATDQVAAFAEAGEGWGMDGVPLGFEPFADELPRPAAHTAAVHQDETGHAAVSCGSRLATSSDGTSGPQR